MAYEATHLRFAHDLKPHLDIQGDRAYYTGAVYPDSRYVTGIERDLTHKKDVPGDPFTSGLSDFEKGWATHLLYDTAQGELLTVLNLRMEERGRQKGAWQYFTAMKLIEDMKSVEVFRALSETIDMLTFQEAPLGEDKEALDEYLGIIRELYETAPTIGTYKTMWLKLGVPKPPADGIVKFAKEIIQDEETVKTIQRIYDDTLKEVLSTR